MSTEDNGFGFSLAGGMDEPSVNPTDPADHGIFVAKVCGEFAQLIPSIMHALFRLIQEV